MMMLLCLCRKLYCGDRHLGSRLHRCRALYWLVLLTCSVSLCLLGLLYSFVRLTRSSLLRVHALEGRPILQGGNPAAKDESENDLDQYIKICELCGSPTETTWTGVSKLSGRFPIPKEAYERRVLQTFTVKRLRGIASAPAFIDRLLALDPTKRPTAAKALDVSFPLLGSDVGDLLKRRWALLLKIFVP